MNLTEDAKLKINEIFPGEKNEGIREKLLSGDVRIIREIGRISQNGIDPKDVLSKGIEELYTKAKRLLDLQDLYKCLCEECAKNEVENVKE